MRTILKRFFFLFLLCCYMTSVSAQESEYPVIIKGDMEYYQYSPETGEGIYSISRRFSVPLTELLRHNPSLESGLRKGDIVLVPIIKATKNRYHIIAPKETVYSISKQYDITSEQLIAANPGIGPEAFPIGREIVIPESGQSQPTETVKQVVEIAREDETPHTDEMFVEDEDEPYTEEPKEAVAIDAVTSETSREEVGEIRREKKSSYSIVLMLPFTGKNEAAEGNRYIEYYEGFLLAVNSMKAKGLSLDLYVYDTGLSGKSVKAHLNNPLIDAADLIIGGIDQKEIKELSDFSKSKGIKYVIPFSSRLNTDLANPNVFQINLPQNTAQTKAIRVYATLFKDKNIVIVNCHNNNKQEFITSLKSELRNASVPFSEITYSATFMDDVKPLLVSGRKNIIIPSSESAETLQSITPALRSIGMNRSIEISLFGYPEWQVHAKDLLESLFLLDTHFFATFYTNNTSPEIQNFYDLYKHWYHKNLLPLYPKYGILGFDTGMFFMNALHKFGTAFDLELENCAIPLLQSSFHFQRVQENDLFLNMNLFVVQFTPDFTVKKTLVR